MKKYIKGVYCLTFPNGKKYVGIGMGKKGKISWLKGTVGVFKHTKETKIKMSLSKLGKKRRN